MWGCKRSHGRLLLLDVQARVCLLANKRVAIAAAPWSPRKGPDNVGNGEGGRKTCKEGAGCNEEDMG